MEEERKKQIAIEEAVVRQLQTHMRVEDEGKEQAKRWHIGREIPLAVILVLMIQTAGVIWWAASTSAKVDFMKETNVAASIVQAAVDRRQDDESQRSETRIMTQLDKLNVKLDKLMESRGVR